jgi:hypothetical protein
MAMILMYTAQQLTGFNMLEQGAGELVLTVQFDSQKRRQDLPPVRHWVRLCLRSSSGSSSTISYGSSNFTFMGRASSGPFCLLTA